MNGVPREVPRLKPEGPQAPKGFLPQDFPRDSIHHDTPWAFPHIIILSASWTSKEGWSMFLAEGTQISRIKSHYTSPGCRKNEGHSVCALQKIEARKPVNSEAL